MFKASTLALLRRNTVCHLRAQLPLLASGVYIGNLAWSMQTPELQQNFEEFGTVSECRIITDRQTGQSRGFGFITFEQGDAAEAAAMKMEGVEVNGRTLRVRVLTEDRLQAPREER